MKTEITVRNTADRERLDDRVHRRLEFALSRFASRIDRVHVMVADVNGPRGGEDKLCRVRVRLHAGGCVTIHARGAQAETAIDMAAGRAGRSVARELRRLRPSREVPLPDAAGEGANER